MSLNVPFFLSFSQASCPRIHLTLAPSPSAEVAEGKSHSFGLFVAVS